MAAPGFSDSVSYVPTQAITDTTYFRRRVIDQSCGDTAFSNIIQITVPDAFSFNESIVDASCFGASDGSISLNAMGGNMPYTFTWSNSDTTDTIQNLSAGIYSVTLTDANGCADSVTYTIGQPAFSQGSETITACDNFFWSATGLTYTATGSYLDTLSNTSGCDSVVSLT